MILLGWCCKDVDCALHFQIIDNVNQVAREREEKKAREWMELMHMNEKQQTIHNALESIETWDTCQLEAFNEFFAEFYATEDQSWIVRSLRAKINRRSDCFQFFWDDNTKLFTIEDLGDGGVHLIDQ